MKLIVIIPAFNEEKTIGSVIKNIPRNINNINKVEVVVINDGSNDKTKEVALNAGADLVLDNTKNLGLAKTFARGIETALKRSADIIINLDADGQHNPHEIPKFINSIIKNKNQMVIGNRKINNEIEMKFGNKYGNLLGSWLIRKLSRSNIQDASCGYRALTKEAALRLNILSTHTYTHETIIQAAFKNLKMDQVSISCPPRKVGKSRLINSLFGHIKSSGLAILRTILMYKPLKTLFYLGSIIMLPGIIIVGRFIFYFFIHQRAGIQSLVVSAMLITVGFFVITLGLLGDLIAKNRSINEKILYELKKQKYSK